MQKIFFIVLAFVWGIPFVFAAAFAAEPSWHTSLSYDGGGVWKTRFPVDITNNGKNELAGFPVAVSFSTPLGDNVRVVHAGGQEVVFGRRQSDLTIPIDAKPGETVRYYVYSDNPQAKILIPEQEMLQERMPPIIGDFEKLDDWTFDEQDAVHKIFQCSDEAVSGKHSIKTVVSEGAEPSWISIRQDRILIQPGAKYRFSGWVKAENLNGFAGWYIHVGPEGKPFTISPMLTTDEKTFGWKKLETEFTAPADAAVADLGTVLRGTGTAWFDDVKLQRLDTDEGLIKTVVGPAESCPLKILAVEFDADLHPSGYECLSRFRIVNDSDAEIKDATVLFDLRGSFAHGRVGLPCEIIVENSDGTRVPGVLMDPENRQVSAKLSVIPSRSVNFITVYYKIDESFLTGTPRSTISSPLNVEGTAHPELQMQADPYAGLPSVLKNGDFESGGTAWNGEGTVETDPNIVRFGKSCGKVVLDEKDAGNWRGYRQTVPVDGGRAYLISAWLKCRDLPGGGRIHIHFHTANGQFTASGGMTSMDREVHGTTDWTHVSQVMTAPNDAVEMSLHLTTNQPGTLWYDNLAVLDSLHAELFKVESIADDPLVPIWQVPTVMKVFPQSIPPQSAIDAKKEGRLVAKISTAKNETESLQLAFRYDQQRLTKPAKIVVSPMIDGKGNVLAAPTISHVGYVPIDYPSNYYNDTNPRWYRKTPKSAPGCDGWPGLWPDPLYPSEVFMPTFGNNNFLRTLNRETNAVWLTWSIPKDAVAGIYKGKVTFPHDDAIYPPIDPVMPIEVTVYDFTLPDESGVSATYDARFAGPRGIWGKRDADVYAQAVELMAANRLEPDEIKPAPRISFRNGKFEFDWTAFDRAAAHLFDDLQIKFIYTPNLFYLFGWGHPPKEFFGEKPYDGEWPYKDADRSKLRPEYKTRYQTALREFWRHIKEKGWAEKFVLYISDEPNHWEEPIKRQMIALCEMIHEVDPAIPIFCSTWGYVPEWADSLDVWGIGHYGIVPPETMDAIRKRGSRIWFTTDGMMCLDTPYSAIERLLPHYCFKYGAEAYEFWGIAWLTFDPWKYGFHAYIHQSSTPGEYYWVRYPNGDGYLLYPPPDGQGDICSSIRFEQARDGVEDYEYLRMLQTLIDSHPAHPATDSAKQALDAATALVECPTQIGRYSTRILPNPYRLEQVRENVAREIEKFSR